MRIFAGGGGALRLFHLWQEVAAAAAAGQQLSANLPAMSATSTGGISTENGTLWIERVTAATLAAEFGTPLYAYASGAIVEGFAALRSSLGGEHLACFAVKANGNLSLLRTLAEGGGGADVVSGGELRRAERAGFAPQKLVFSGVGKTAEELRAALNMGILQVSVESTEEFELLRHLGRRGIPVAFRINPQISAGGHEHIRTGRRGDKFGICDKKEVLRLAVAAAADPKFRFMGLSVHLGSQIADLNTFAEGWRLLASYAEELRGQGVETPYLDGGGGLGLSGCRAMRDWAKLAIKTLGGNCRRLILEPGRAVVGAHGALLTRVIRSKKSGDKNWLIVDAAMNDLARPSLYQAEHPIIAAEPTARSARKLEFAVAGPICESGDVWAKKARLPPLTEGTLLALLEVGAYGSAMGSAYNARPLTAEALVKGDKYALVRRAVDAEALMEFEPMASWLG